MANVVVAGPVGINAAVDFTAGKVNAEKLPRLTSRRQLAWPPWDVAGEI